MSTLRGLDQRHLEFLLHAGWVQPTLEAMCHGVLGYLEHPEPMVDQLCRCAGAGGLVSIMTGNAKTLAVCPALERRWDDALASFDATTEIGVLGVQGRGAPAQSCLSSSRPQTRQLSIVPAAWVVASVLYAYSRDTTYRITTYWRSSW